MKGGERKKRSARDWIGKEKVGKKTRKEMGKLSGDERQTKSVSLR